MAFELDSNVRQQFLDTFSQGTGGVFKPSRMSTVLNNVQKKIQLVDAGTPAYAMAQSTLNFINNVVNKNKGGSKEQLEALRGFIQSGNSALEGIDPSWLKDVGGKEFTGKDSVIERINNRIAEIDSNNAKRTQDDQKARAEKAKNERIQDNINRMKDPEVQATNKRLLQEGETRRIWREDGSSYRVSNSVGMDELKVNLMKKHYGNTHVKPTPIGVSHSDRTPIDVPEGSQYQKGSREYYKARHERKHGDSPHSQPLSQEDVDAIIDRTKDEIQAERDAKYQARVERRRAKKEKYEAQSKEQTRLQFEANDAYERGDISSPSVDEYQRWKSGGSAPGTDGSPGRVNTRAVKDTFGRIGSKRRITNIRNQLGSEYASAAKKYNSRMEDIIREAEGMRANGDTRSLEQIIDSSKDLSRKRAIAWNESYGNARDLEGKLRASFEDYASIHGNLDKVTKASAKGQVTSGMAFSGYAGAALEVREASQEFTAKVGDNNYRYVQTDTSKYIAGEGTKVGDTSSSWKRYLVKDGGEEVLENIDESSYKSALEAAGKDVQIKSTAERVTEYMGTGHAGGKGQGIRLEPKNLTKGANADAYAKTYSQEAAKIAKTTAGENSGIFKQIVQSASDHPWIAAGIAIGGFALANKALDRRREYD